METSSLKSAFDPFSSENEIVPNGKSSSMNLVLEQQPQNDTNIDSSRDKELLNNILKSINSLSYGIDNITNSTDSGNKLAEIQKNLYVKDNTSYNKNITKNEYKSFLKNMLILNSQKTDPIQQKNDPIQQEPTNFNSPRFLDIPTSKIQEVNTAVLGDGGIVDKPTLAIVGENGPEAITPLNKLKTSQKSHANIFDTKNDNMNRIASNEASIQRALETDIKINDLKERKKTYGSVINPTNMNELIDRGTSPIISESDSGNAGGLLSSGGGGISSFSRSLHHEIKIPAWRTHFG